MTFKSRVSLITLAFSIAVTALISHPVISAASDKPAATEDPLKSFAALKPVDVHVHVFKTDPAFQ
jgi:hypothetical protein